MSDRLLEDISSQAQQGATGLAAAHVASLLHNTNMGPYTKAISATKFLPGVGIVLAGMDGSRGYSNASKLYNTATPTWQQKLASTVGGLANGASLGIIPANEVAYGYVMPDYIPPKMKEKK